MTPRLMPNPGSSNGPPIWIRRMKSASMCALRTIKTRNTWWVNRLQKWGSHPCQAPLPGTPACGLASSHSSRRKAAAAVEDYQSRRLDRSMKKTLNFDEKLLREARMACGAATDTETVRLGLEALIPHPAYQRLQ